MGTIKAMILDALSLDPEIQPRESLSKRVVQEYAALYRDGQSLPPIQVFQDGIDYWPADGFHRVAAGREAGLSALEAEVTPGTRREAMLYACAANKHGQPRTPADKCRVVRRLLDDPKWREWSDMEIARHCGVAHLLVAKVLCSLDSESSEHSQRTYRTKHGTVATMQTRRIGRSKSAEATDTPPPRSAMETPEHAGAGDDLRSAPTSGTGPRVMADEHTHAHEAVEDAVAARAEGPAPVTGSSLRPNIPLPGDESPDQNPLHVLRLMEELCAALPPIAMDGGTVIISEAWTPELTAQYRHTCTVLLDRLYTWQRTLPRQSPSSGKEARDEDLDSRSPVPSRGTSPGGAPNGSLSGSPAVPSTTSQASSPSPALAAPAPPEHDDRATPGARGEGDQRPAIEAGGSGPEAPTQGARQAVLMRIKRLQAMGSSLRSIAGQFNHEGVPTFSGRGRWDSSTLSRLLRSDDGGTPVPVSGGHPPSAA